MTHAKLKVSEAGPPESAADLFESVLRPFIEANTDHVRAIGGAFGFVIGAEQWVIDFGAVTVVGGGERAAVEERSGLDLVLSLSTRELRAAIQGRPPKLLHVVSGDLARVPRLVRALSGAAPCRRRGGSRPARRSRPLARDRW